MFEHSQWVYFLCVQNLYLGKCISILPAGMCSANKPIKHSEIFEVKTSADIL